MAKCTRVGCSKEAQWLPGFRVYALHFPKIKKNMIEAFLPLPTCDDCKEEIELKDIFTKDNGVKLNQKMVSLGRAPIDSTTAELVWRHDGDPA